MQNQIILLMSLKYFEFLCIPHKLPTYAIITNTILIFNIFHNNCIIIQLIGILIIDMFSLYRK